MFVTDSWQFVCYVRSTNMADSDEHIKPRRLFEIADNDSFKLTAEEKNHFRNCEECQYVVAVFARQFCRQVLHDHGNAA